MRKKKKPFNYKQNIALHKMDDESRRAFIRQCGIFMSVFGVSSLVRLETMEKLSKKIFGSATAFAQSSGSNPYPTLQIGMRAGPSLSYIVGFQTADYDVNAGNTLPGFKYMNQPYSPADTVRVATTNGADLVVPSYNSGLTTYANGISANHSYAAASGHTSVHVSVCGDGNQNVMSLAAEQSTASPILTNPLSFTRINDVEYPTNNAVYAPQYITNVDDFVNQFVEQEIVAGDGSQLSAAVKESLFTVLSQSYNDQIEKALKTEEKQEIMRVNDKGALSLLQADFRTQLDPNSGFNTDFRNAIANGLPNTNGMTFGADPVESIVTALRAWSLGIVYPYSAIQVRIADGHNFQRHALAAKNDTTGNGTDGLGGGGYLTARTGQFVGVLIKNILDVFSGATSLTNELTNIYSPGQPWSTDNAQVNVHEEFCRRDEVLGTDDNGMTGNNADGDNIAVGVFCSNVNQTHLPHTGSHGGIQSTTPTNKQRVYYDPSTKMHTTTGSYRSGMSSFGDTLKAMNIDAGKAGLSVETNDDLFS
ncbi:MAG: hypothetical protein KDK51_02575 [Deltaproteobacteria bacterium]|nr:hypothetical protein [Deltaproteobacteria bacterium]